MQKLTDRDLRLVLSRTPREVREIMGEGAILAGGFLRAVIAQEEIADIDLFGPDTATMRQWAVSLAEAWGGRVHESDNAYTVLAPARLPVQLIVQWTYSHVEDVVDDFDWTVTQAGIEWVPDDDHDSGGYWASYCARAFYPDLAAKRLVWSGRPAERDDNPGGPLLRLRKYLRRGYQIYAEDLAAAVARAVAKLDPEDLGLDPDMAEWWPTAEPHLHSTLSASIRSAEPQAPVTGLDPEED